MFYSLSFVLNNSLFVIVITFNYEWNSNIMCFCMVIFECISFHFLFFSFFFLCLSALNGMHFSIITTATANGCVWMIVTRGKWQSSEIITIHKWDQGGFLPLNNEFKFNCWSISYRLYQFLLVFSWRIEELLLFT